MYAKFIGVTPETAALIEARRKTPEQSENDILLEVLRPAGAPAPNLTVPYALGQGVTAYVGEKLFLFLDEHAKKARRPAGTAEVRSDGLYVDGRRVERSRGSEITPAMRIIQERVSHRSGRDIISLNAYLKWHVLRDGQIVSLFDLKDPAKARKRGRSMTAEQAKQFLNQLGLGETPPA
jgi:hypothetical protein